MNFKHSVHGNSNYWTKVLVMTNLIVNLVLFLLLLNT